MVIPCIQAGSLSRLGGIRHAFFARSGGVSTGVYATLNGGIGSADGRTHVLENRARMARSLGVIPTDLITGYQTHSSHVAVLDGASAAGQRPRADGLVTNHPGLALAVTTADCGPVLMAEERARVVAAVHAGWRGAASGVLEAALAAMEKCGADRNRIVVALGPMIRQSSYEVGTDLIAAVAKQGQANDRFFAPAERAGHALFDLAGYIAARLRTAGIRHIEDVGQCTYSDPVRFFSYRRSVHRHESDYGRHISAIVLSP
jgi:YfiH family protein